MAIAVLFAVSVVLSTLAATPPMEIARQLPAITIPARTSTFTITLRLAETRKRLLAAATDRTRDVVLDLDGIEAARSPAVYFEVYVHAARAVRGHSAGNVALFGNGIRSEAQGAFHPAHVQLVITEDLLSALRTSSTVAITLVAQGAGGSPTPARSASTLIIGRPSIMIVPRSRE